MKIDQYCQRQRCTHVELEQFWYAFVSRGFVSDSWAFLFIITVSGWTKLWCGLFVVSFDNYMQHDAHEFLNYLLNTIADLLQGEQIHYLHVKPSTLFKLSSNSSLIRVLLISVSVAWHQFTPWDHGYRANASRGVPVYFPATGAALPLQVIPPADANAYGRHTPWLAD